MTEPTNVWDFLTKLVEVSVPATVTIVTYLLTRRGQDPKLDNIEKATNGKSAADTQRIAELEAHVENLKRSLP